MSNFYQFDARYQIWYHLNMARQDKLRDKIAQNPKHVRFTDLDRLLRDYGFAVRQPRGGSSHYVYTRGAIRITVPYHRPHVKEHYVREVLKLLVGVNDEKKS